LLTHLTGGSRRIALPEWQRVQDDLSTMVRTEGPLRDKVSLLGALAFQTCRRRERLLRDATRALRQPLFTR